MSLARLAGIAGATAAALAVACGAFGAHALRNHLDADALATWRIAVDYQFWHALALVLVAALARMPNRALRFAAFAFIAGIVLFCASLYALALGAPRALGMLTPVGGVAFIVGWITLALGCRGAAR
ncbi:MAG: DUF423 domain-containing protein [Xanthomonadales bacterium]|nr:DUF423 domain-containing protein [Xanthomonadales bacterium]